MKTIGVLTVTSQYDYHADNVTLLEAYDSKEKAFSAMDDEVLSFINERVFMDDRIIEVFASPEELHCQVLWTSDSKHYEWEVFEIRNIDLR